MQGTVLWVDFLVVVAPELGSEWAGLKGAEFPNNNAVSSKTIKHCLQSSEAK